MAPLVGKLDARCQFPGHELRRQLKSPPDLVAKQLRLVLESLSVEGQGVCANDRGSCGADPFVCLYVKVIDMRAQIREHVCSTAHGCSDLRLNVIEEECSGYTDAKPIDSAVEVP
jgi:hypothetical protein